MKRWSAFEEDSRGCQSLADKTEATSTASGCQFVAVLTTWLLRCWHRHTATKRQKRQEQEQDMAIPIAVKLATASAKNMSTKCKGMPR